MSIGAVTGIIISLILAFVQIQEQNRIAPLSSSDNNGIIFTSLCVGILIGVLLGAFFSSKIGINLAKILAGIASTYLAFVIIQLLCTLPFMFLIWAHKEVEIFSILAGIIIFVIFSIVQFIYVKNIYWRIGFIGGYALSAIFFVNTMWNN
ncbi:MAG: hypothetical protein EXS50_03625 [Candidatus Taylorbacteria bacterium]|nr:hypothetical protein [Candidatus Taylorbacteria bacterium]